MLPDLFPIEAKEDDYLYVKQSQIAHAGLGLFTAIKLYKGDIIAEFKGEIINASTHWERSGLHASDYFMNLPDGRTLDCQFTEGFAKMANDGMNSGFKQNAGITMDEQRVVLVAMRTIHIDEEIFTSYGKHYWKAKTNRTD